MKIAALQFSVDKSISKNLEVIKQSIIDAAQNDCRLLITQECALCGYPPIEINSIKDIDFIDQDSAIRQILDLSKEHNIHIALGLIRKESDLFMNSIMLISPEGIKGYYDKRALWGWDKKNYSPGRENIGVWEIDGIRIGIRICFEIRFPEYFRELYKENVEIAIVSFCDISKTPNENRLNIIKSHLLTRAIENAYTIISVNGTTLNQTAPTCVINPDGLIVAEASMNKQEILYYKYEKTVDGFGRQGRIHYNDKLTVG